MAACAQGALNPGAQQKLTTSLWEKALRWEGIEATREAASPAGVKARAWLS